MASRDTSAFTLLEFFHNFDSSSPIAKACGRASMISPASILRISLFQRAARSPHIVREDNTPNAAILEPLEAVTFRFQIHA